MRRQKFPCPWCGVKLRRDFRLTFLDCFLLGILGFFVPYGIAVDTWPTKPWLWLFVVVIVAIPITIVFVGVRVVFFPPELKRDSGWVDDGTILHITTPPEPRPRPHQTSPAPDNDTYLGLRNLALQTDRAKIGLPPPTAANAPWGAIMDWGMHSGTATVVAFSDGGASIYLSSGGGYLGGGQSHDAIQKAAREMVAAAAECLSQTHATTSYPLPEKGEVCFFLLTDQGVFTASASELDLRSNRHPMAKLGRAAQNVITQYRLSVG